MSKDYGSVITEQGDLGLGVIPINESKEEKKNNDKKDDKESKGNKK